jgi:hypothetical protein
MNGVREAMLLAEMDEVNGVPTEFKAYLGDIVRLGVRDV